MSERPWSDAEEAHRVRSGLPPWRDPIDWPARFRAAAELVDGRFQGLAIDFRGLAEDWDMLTPQQAEAVGRVLLGEGS